MQISSKSFQIVKGLYLEELISETVEGKRHYVTPAGSFPSITTVLSATSDNTWLDAWKARVGAEEAAKISLAATTIGTGMHSLCEAYIKGEPSPSIPGPASIMFKYLKPALDKSISLVCGVEVPLYSSKLKIAGRTDLIAFWDGKLSVIDYKSNHSDRMKSDEDVEDYKQQICAYALMWNERMGEIGGPTIKQGVILMASKYGRQIWLFNPYEYEATIKKRIEAYHLKYIC